jgi:DNA-binding CsgD family transcriptional regulator/PAS domain-containing protein
VALPAVVTRYSDAAMDAYYRHHSHINPFVPLLMKAPLLTAHRNEEFLSRERLLRSEFYNDFLRPQEDIGAGGGGIIFNEAGRILILSGQVRFRDGESKIERLTAYFDLLMPHVRQAFAIQRRLSLTEGLAESRRTLLDRATSPSFLIDAQYRVAWFNAAAEALLAGPSPVVLGTGGALGFADIAAQRRLEAAVKAILVGDPPSAAPAFRVGEGGWYASLVPLPRGSRASPGWLPEAPVALLVLSDPAPVPNPMWPVHAAEHGLTPAEAALAEALAAGQSLAAHAEARGRSLHTVRAQAKALFAKLRVGSQAELVASLSRFFH